MRTIISTTVLAISIGGCTQPNPGQHNQSSASQEVAELREQIARKGEEISTLQAEVSSNKRLISHLNNRLPSSVALISPTSPGYSIVSSNVFPVLVSFNSIEPLGAGSRASINIGNISSATLQGAKLKVTAISTKRDENDLAITTEIEHKHLERIPAGSWSIAHISIDGIKPDELQNLIVAIELDVLVLR